MDILVRSNFASVDVPRAIGVNRMPVYVIYENPEDYPGKYVARLHVVEAGESYATNLVAVRNTLKDIRMCIPATCQLFARDEKDDPCIVETWI